MSAYTDEDLLAVARVVWPIAAFPLTRSRQALLGQPVNYADDYRVRLALAHPERADKALGPGWRVNVSGELVWEMPRTCPHQVTNTYLIVSLRRGLLGGLDITLPIPPEFDAALSRARLIAAAWARIENKEV